MRGNASLDGLDSVAEARYRSRMRSSLRLIAPLLVFVMSGCGLIGFDVSQDIPEDTVPGSALGGLLPALFSVPLTIDLEAEQAKRDTGPVSSASLKSLSFAATPHNAPMGNFDFIDELHVSIARSDAPNDKVEIAKLAPVPKGKTSISLQPIDGVDLLPYIKAGATVTGSGSGHQPTQDFSYDGSITLHLKL